MNDANEIIQGIEKKYTACRHGKNVNTRWQKAFEELAREFQEAELQHIKALRNAASLIAHCCPRHEEEICNEDFRVFKSKLVCERCLKEENDRLRKAFASL